MTTPLPRPRSLAILAVLCGLLIAAPAAHAGVGTWTSLTGLTAPTPSWVRVYATGTPPTTMYAGTEGDGVYRSVTAGVSWSLLGALPGDAAKVRAIYTSGGKVYAGTDGGLWSHSASGSEAAWVPIAQGPEPTPDSPTRLNQAVQAVTSVLGGAMLAGTASEGVFRSSDDGATWQPPADNNGMPPATTVWSFANFAGFVWAATSDGIYRSLDGGATWSLASDGIPPSATTLDVFPDGKVPTIYYAATASDGLYRTLDGGLSWQPMNFADYSGGILRAVQEFSGDKETRIYTATYNGVWVATTPNITAGPIGGITVPGKITWRHLDETGLGANTIMWALSNFTTTPGTFLAGTQSNGGYAYTLQPPSNSGQAADLPGWVSDGIVLPAVHFAAGDAIIGRPGNWNGSPDIDYAYQWQRCTTTSSGSCSDIDGATDAIYTLTPADQGDHYRDCVTATNDFPEPIKALHTACSAVSSFDVAAPPVPLPGSTQQSAATIRDPAGDISLPNEGDTLTAPSQPGDPGGWLFKPAAASVAYQWQRCDENGDHCQDISGATNATYKVVTADDGQTIRVIVTGGNGSGGYLSLQPSGTTHPIIPLAAANVTAPALKGKQYVGDTLTGTVGTWKSPNTTWTRQWERCEPDGSDCSPIFNATGPEYTLTADDYNETVRLRVTGDVNESFKLPLAVDAYSALSSVIQYPPGVTPPAPPPGPGPSPAPPGPAKPTKPSVSGLKLTTTSKGGKLSFKLSASGSVKVKLQRAEKGHRVKSHCVAGRKRHATSCTAYVTVETVTAKKLKAGTHSVTLKIRIHGHLLKAGTYRALVTPYDSSGHAGVAHTLKLVVRRT